MKTIYEVERDLILATLMSFGWNRMRSAVSLGCAIRTLRNKINRYKKEGFEIKDSQYLRKANERNRQR